MVKKKKRKEKEKKKEKKKDPPKKEKKKNGRKRKGRKKREEDGLSGLHIKDLSTQMIKKFYKEVKKKIPIIGVGGVDSGPSAFEKIIAGATAVQLYTGMVYKGPGIVKEIKKDLISTLKKEKIKKIGDAVGINA